MLRPNESLKNISHQRVRDQCEIVCISRHRRKAARLALDRMESCNFKNKITKSVCSYLTSKCGRC